MDKVVRDGKVAVLYSPDYGAGWFSWNPDRIEILFDPAIIELVEAKSWEELKTYVTLKYPDLYMGGIDDLEIEWVPEGALFVVQEHDGKEWIELRDQINWIQA
jgi:hypothetical protein